MEKRYTLKVYPKGLGKSVYRVVELCGNESLDKLCKTILDAFDFEDAHLYEFCMDNTMYSRDCYQPEYIAAVKTTKITLDRLGLLERQKFLFHYDFGDDWEFVVRVEKITDDVEYAAPELIKSKGDILQYPDLDEFWGTTDW